MKKRKGREKIDLSGERFDRLLVLYDTEERYAGSVIWRCKCDCGGFTDVPSRSLRSGNTRSCGCLHREAISKNMTEHILSTPMVVYGEPWYQLEPEEIWESDLR